MFYMIVAIAVIGLVVAGALLYAFGALSEGTRRSETVADGSIYIAILLLAIVINVAITSPALIILQPLWLRQVLSAEKAAKTPRQRFRGMAVISHWQYAVPDLRRSYVPQDVQSAVRNVLLYTGCRFCEYIRSDFPAVGPSGCPVIIPYSSRYVTYVLVLNSL